ncbi:MAG: hypothetical protein HY928_11385 [Elusimicrobia bacterium]|nr:hypothetical protein [Elusimicrobiota bacterium]
MMKWPAIRHLALMNLVPELRKRVDLVIPPYKETVGGALARAWVSVDGERVPGDEEGERAPDGTYSASEFVSLVYEYLDIPPPDALRSESALWRALAAADKRLKAPWPPQGETDALVLRLAALRRTL